MAKNKRIDKKCIVCGSLFSALEHRSHLHKYCGHECSYRANYLDAGPIEKKAKILAANILGGKGKLSRMIDLIKSSIGSGCKYCGYTLSIDNISLDHKTPYRSSSDRRNKAENKEIRAHMDRWDNLHIVCSRCNQLKGTLTHEQYVSLKEFLSYDQDMKRIVETRLMRSSAPFYGKRF